MIKIYLLIAFLYLSLSLLAQKSDTLKLSCPLNEAIETPVEKQPYSLGEEELKIVLRSLSDTTVKACTSGTITNVMRDEDGTWIVIFNNKDYYFWYSGLSKTAVKKGQKIQNGDAIGYLKPGEKIELQAYDFETPIDPKKYLDCRKVSGQL